MEDHTRPPFSHQKPVDSNFYSESYLWETVPKFSASLNNFLFFSEHTSVGARIVTPLLSLVYI